MYFFIRGDVTIHYEVHGSGFPLLLLPPGGMNAALGMWNRAAFNPIEIFSRDYMVIAMDERNAGESTGPLDTDDPWAMYAADQLGLMNHLGIQRFHALGCCIGCSQVLRLAQQAGDRMAAGVLEQPVGVDENNRTVLPNMWQDWASQLTAKRPDITMQMCEQFGRKMWEGDFVLSVTR
ncbi:MAG TPA: alpha/beta hydrolase, partial [Chloroflexota bacterium]